MNKLIYDTLKSIVNPAVPVYHQDAELEEPPEEYIQYVRIYGNERNFAANAAHEEYHYYRINYYGKSDPRLSQVMKAIKTAMKAAGFYLQEDNIPIPRDSGAAYYGAYSEFAYWGVVT